MDLKIFTLILTLLAGIPSCFSLVSTLKDLSKLEGQSVTVPCTYDPQYASHVKYWCRGLVKDFCKIMVRSDATPEDSRVSLSDDPTQMVFTVTMEHLKKEDSAWYWCGVEVGGMWTADDTASIYISVIQDVLVKDHMVSGEEGGSIKVTCLYSENHRTSVKKWCRSGDWNSCVTLESNRTVQVGSVQISDDRSGAFNVTLRSLEVRDEGWYRCEAGYQQATVRIDVIPRARTKSTPTSTSLPQKVTPAAVGPEDAWLPDSSLQDAPSDIVSRYMWESPLMTCGALMVLVLVLMVIWKLTRQYKRRTQAEMKAEYMKCPELMNPPTLFVNTPSQQVKLF